jgi:methionyl-tRNA synthetase
LFRQLVVYLSPVLPQLADDCGELLGDPITSWNQSQTPLVGRTVNAFKRMMNRVQLEDLEKMIEEEKTEGDIAEAVVHDPYNDSDQPLKDEPLADEITIEDFAKVDLRVARVISAEHVPEADKLLKLTLSLGGTERRQVFAGIKAAYEPETLVGRLVVMVANLKPRKMRFGLSEGMVTASGPGGAEVFVLGVDEGALPGQRVH